VSISIGGTQDREGGQNGLRVLASRVWEIMSQANTLPLESALARNADIQTGVAVRLVL